MDSAARETPGTASPHIRAGQADISSSGAAFRNDNVFKGSNSQAPPKSSRPLLTFPLRVKSSNISTEIASLRSQRQRDLYQVYYQKHPYYDRL